MLKVLDSDKRNQMIKVIFYVFFFLLVSIGEYCWNMRLFSVLLFKGYKDKTKFQKVMKISSSQIFIIDFFQLCRHSCIIFMAQYLIKTSTIRAIPILQKFMPLRVKICKPLCRSLHVTNFLILDIK